MSSSNKGRQTSDADHRADAHTQHECRRETGASNNAAAHERKQKIHVTPSYPVPYPGQSYTMNQQERNDSRGVRRNSAHWVHSGPRVSSCPATWLSLPEALSSCVDRACSGLGPSGAVEQDKITSKRQKWCRDVRTTMTRVAKKKGERQRQGGASGALARRQSDRRCAEDGTRSAGGNRHL